ncbi:MEDS domain-containing protein [Dehalogenimonas etheniformans]|uniref:Oxygen sensor histidine kinase NreB n=1 Tax=Dehalogenimonas etheniformans TaxID=1536648 RepID=A0A2P5P6U0_9CHLR|nr:MEDS domain-containing protein [Dehalogenimonas etheniformans]PPD58013.1 PAS domain S-box protein [Dehalogenimonas etheniformans]QNT75363.1 MEDS domain-containing protein [Dehalogenimonas etheniformans]
METLRLSGIDIIGNVPWGTHFCQFYQTKQDLIDTLVPYFRSGLLNNEFCMWITSEPLNVAEAKTALAEAVPDLESRIASGQIEILSHRNWYLPEGMFNSDKVLAGWVEKLNNALDKGFDGLRLSGNTFWLEKADWDGFTDYEHAVDSVISQYNMLALCTYSLEKCGAPEILDVIKNHEFALIQQKGQWQLIESSTHRQTRQAMQRQQEQILATYRSMREGLCLHELVFDDSGKAVDYRILDVNPAFEAATGLERAKSIGQKASVLYGTGKPPYFDVYERVALTGEPESFETYFPPMGKHFSISVFSPGKNRFGTIFSDITERKNQESKQALLNGILKILNRHDSLQAIVGDTLRLIKQTTGFEAVGLRLCQGDDYPYFGIDGFTDEFVREENFLCHRGGDGRVLKDPSGRPVLECTCGLLISGRELPDMPCFTPAGGFWTNNSTDLLSLTPEEDPRINPRNRCIHTGFASVGLFPVTAGNEIVGLLQLNDRQAGRFTPEQVNFFESIAANIGMALQRLSAEEQLQQAKDSLETKISERTAELAQAHSYVRSLIEAAVDPLVTINPDGKITDVNKATVEATGASRETLIGDDFCDYFTEPDKARRAYLQVFADGAVIGYPLTIRRSDGKSTDVLYNASVYRDLNSNVLGVFAAARDVTELKRAELELREQVGLRRRAEETARALSNRLMGVQEAERRAIARELHDEIGQGLTVAKLMAARADRQAPEELHPILKDLSEQIGDIIRNVRNLSLSLRPGVLDELGLVPALEWLFKQLHTQAGLKVSFECQPLPPLPIDQATGTFRVVQEALTNVMRYSGVKEARVSLKPDGDNLCVGIWDNGRGFDPSSLQPGQSTGLSAMRERAALLGGTCECDSAPGKGTNILLTLPIRAGAKS